MIYSISYDVNKPKTNVEYEKLYEKIKSAPGWCHAMESLWFIKTNESVDVWSNRLRSCMDNNDWLFVVDITRQPRQGWMKKEVWDWLREHDG